MMFDKASKQTESQRPISRWQCGTKDDQRTSYIGDSENFEKSGPNTVDHAFTDSPGEDFKQSAATDDKIQGSRLIITSLGVASNSQSDIYWEFLDLSERLVGKRKVEIWSQ